MRKKITLALSMILLLLMLCACGKTDPKAVDYNGYSYSELEQYALAYSEFTATFYDYTLPMYGLTAEDLNDDRTFESLNAQFEEVGITAPILDSVIKWDEVIEEVGVYKSVKENSFAIEKAGNTLTTEIILYFVNEDGIQKEVVYQVIYDYYNMEVTGITIEPVYSLGEKLQKAGINTIISMSVVFIVLILISLIIWAFNIIPYFEKKKKANANEQQTEPVIEQIKQREEQQLMDDTELVAVIAAAIAASEGTTTSDFVVRSINRR